MEQTQNLEELFKSIQEYIDTQKKLVKLHAVEKVSIASSTFAANLIIISFFLLMFLFVSLALAYFLSEYFGKTSMGFGIGGVMYLFVGLVLYVKRESWLKTPLANSIVNNMMNHE